ncbi:ATP-binding protein [Paenibacillus dendritiformis]|uniref:ATP-binding protein n=1 Tax=Paenibacillus dendritiformis TaxID=130049 RepID=UPI00248D3191|nr:ATP-binding protein [Paenibacillus dendritiformis]WGU97234.1 ATP-binding protein [Paenibacillus dendritiformis]
MYNHSILNDQEVRRILTLEEDHFYDLKSKRIAPSKLSESISSFANTSGGDIYVGIEEIEKHSKHRVWEGFKTIEEANAHIQVIDSLSPLANHYEINFLKHPELKTYVLQITIFKSIDIIYATNGLPYIRRGAQKLPVDTPEKKRRLELDKGIIQFENEPVNEADLSDILESSVYDNFIKNIVPNTEKSIWLKKQKLCKNNIPTVAGILLFAEEPQITLPKRSAIKIYRYKTSGKADRDTLDGQPFTFEGCAYDQIYAAVNKTKEIVESMKKLGKGFESIQYPQETLHEIITNAIIHRDYSIATDTQIRIFDNRIEVESPGKLPGHITVKNILDEQSARNPKIVRIINKFPEAPNKDVGEGLNTAFEAMTKLRLKVPIIRENDNSVLVIIRHEKLASPEEMVINYMKDHSEITNSLGRELTGIKSENTMKRVFWKLRDSGMLEPVPGKKGPASAWRKKTH